jgi:hypothetical protein
MHARFLAICAHEEQQHLQQQARCKGTHRPLVGALGTAAEAVCKAALVGMGQAAAPVTAARPLPSGAGLRQDASRVAVPEADAAQTGLSGADVDAGASAGVDGSDSDPRGWSLFCKSSTGRLVTVSIKVRAPAEVRTCALLLCACMPGPHMRAAAVCMHARSAHARCCCVHACQVRTCALLLCACQAHHRIHTSCTRRTRAAAQRLATPPPSPSLTHAACEALSLMLRSG